ncbi:MAG: DsrE family protein [Bacteroidia bacterium]|jgi:uncharacterized protein involved in oxidation of intracellular sulfur|nr:DsrE family protein [Bacteroidia bacterium]
MKKVIFFFLFFGLAISQIIAQSTVGCGGNIQTSSYKPEKIGLVISSNDPETVWNALRLANYSLGEKDTVSIFLLGKGVEITTMASKEFDVLIQLNDFINNGGKILACGTCMRSRNLEGSKTCPISSLSDLYDMVKKCDKTLTF